jgi:protein-arginine kinase activator protein McsA
VSKAASLYYYKEENKISKIKAPIAQEFQFLFAWNYQNFFESNGERNSFVWICKGCRAEVKQWEREQHFENHKRNKEMFLEASRVAANFARESGTGETRVDVCVNCGSTFEQERKRGRPRKQCFDCLPKGE